MTTATINRIRIEKGQYYWVNFQGDVRRAKVTRIIDQHGTSMVKFRVGWPIVGWTVIESLAEFWGRMCKA